MVRHSAGILPQFHGSVATPLLQIRSLQKDWYFLGKKGNVKIVEYYLSDMDEPQFDPP